MSTECCGARLAQGPDDGGAYGETFCRDCDEQTCSACSGMFEVDGETLDGVNHYTVTARCEACQRERVKS